MRRATARGGMITVAAAATLGLVLTGCGAGLDAATTTQRPSVPGVNVSAEDGSVLVRNAAIAFSEESYRAGEDAPVELVIFNQESGPVRLVGASSPDADSVTLGASDVVEPELESDEAGADGAATDPEQDPEGEGGQTDPGLPEQPATEPVELELPGASYAQVTLQLVGLGVEIDGVTTVPVVLEFDNGVSFTLNLAMATPLAPVQRQDNADAEATD